MVHRCLCCSVGLVPCSHSAEPTVAGTQSSSVLSGTACKGTQLSHKGRAASKCPWPCCEQSAVLLRKFDLFSSRELWRSDLELWLLRRFEVNEIIWVQEGCILSCSSGLDVQSRNRPNTY